MTSRRLLTSLLNNMHNLEDEVRVRVLKRGPQGNVLSAKMVPAEYVSGSGFIIVDQAALDAAPEE